MSEFAVTIRRRNDVGFEDASAPVGAAMNSVDLLRPVGPAMQCVPRLPDSAAMNSVPGLNPVAQRPPLGPAMNSTNGPAMNSTNGT